MKKAEDSILFIGDCSEWSRKAEDFLQHTFANVSSIFWENGMTAVRGLEKWHGDWIISFKSDLLLKESFLQHARLGALNFHPSSTKYRGIGGYYYAIDNGDEEFGATCHHMDAKVDHGRIIKTLNFKLAPNESLELLRERTAAICLTLLYDICICIALKEKLPISDQCWGGPLYTKAALQAYLKNRALAKSVPVKPEPIAVHLQ